MRRLQSGIALFCVFLMLAPLAGAQQIQYVQEPQGGLAGLTGPYQPKQIAPIDLANSSRLDSLLRAGNIYLSLQDAIALALENNLDIQIQRYGRPQAEANLLRAQAGGLLRGIPASVQNATTAALSSVSGGAFGAAGSGSSGYNSGGAGGTIITQTGTSIPNLDPSFYVAGQWGHATSPQSNSFTTGTNALVTRNDGYFTGISKGFLTGTNVNLNWQNTVTTSNAGVIDFNPFQNASLNLQVTQRLLQGFGLAVNNRNIRVAKNSLKVNDLVFKQQVIQTVADVVRAYWDLVSFNENARVKQQALQVAQRLYEDNKKQVEIGTLAPIEIVKAESEVANYQQQLVNAQTQVLQQETLLKNALSRTGVASPAISDARIIPTDHIAVPQVEPVIPVQDLTARALENRPEIAQSRISIESTKIGLKGDRSQMLPGLDLVANFSNNGLAGQINSIPNPQDPFAPNGGHGGNPFFIGGFGSALSQVFSRKFPDYSIGVQLVVPLRNRSAQADYIIDALQLRTQELQYQRQINGIRVEVRNALIAVQQASASYQAAVKARELAQQTLEAEQKKYALGASTIFFVIQYQRDLAVAQSNEVAAQSAYAKAKVQLDAATGDLLDRYNVSLDEAAKGRVARPPSALPAVQN
ncbi:MAG: TolC family protein [Acidobacteriota bacterium]